MYAEGVDIFDEAYCYHVALAVTDNLKLKLFPAENRLFNKDLSYERSLKTSCADCLKLFCIIYKTAAGAAHCICRTQTNRIAKLVGNGKSFINRISDLAASHLNAKAVHSFLEFNAVFTALNSVNLNTDYFNIIFFQ